MGVLDVRSYHYMQTTILYIKNVRLKSIGSVGFGVVQGHQAKGDSNALAIASAHKVSEGLVTFNQPMKCHCHSLSPYMTSERRHPSLSFKHRLLLPRVA
jgi:hypothetical protein